MFFRRASFSIAAILAAIVLASAAQAADLSLGGMFSDHAVIQRDKPIAVWGKADPASNVTITLGDQKAMAIANDQGDWRVDLPAMKAGGPYDLTVTSGDKTIALKDILIGDVWICSGQSNMQFNVARSNNGKEEVASADYPNIRIFRVGNNPSLVHVDEVKGVWKQVSPQTIGGFSAVGYFFGRDLYKELNIPIGLVDNSWGGMPAESYTTRATLEADPDLKPMVERLDYAMAHYEENMAAYQKQLEEYNKQHPDDKADPQYMADPGNKGEEKGWAKADFDDAKWKTMKLPTQWELTGAAMNIDGAVWFRKDVTIPADFAGKELTLSLGQIDDFDVTYFDGKQIGATHGSAAESYQIVRNYKVPAELATAGKHVIAVRVFDHFGGGGIYAGLLELKPTDAKSGGIDLSGDWKYMVEVSRPQPGPSGHGPRKPLDDKAPNNPAALWNGMTEPIFPYAIKGVIWYQGESNAGRAYQYRKLFPAMIQDWRKLWGEDTSFLFVQLANYMKAQVDPGERSGWAELREAQDMTLKLPLTAMATAIDVGDANDIHPRDKQTVGHRLALGALAIAYGKDVVYQGPTFDSIKVEGDTIRIKFTHTDGGLKCKGDKLTGFVIAGEDQKWFWADATIDGDTVVVKSADVPHPVAVRYGWANNPAMSLYNGKDLPAPPFRSDDWPGVTVRAK